MAERRGLSWRSEPVIVAVIGAVAVVVAATIGLIGSSDGGGEGAGGGGDSSKTAQPNQPDPTILIQETTFVPRPKGTIEIRVAGGVQDFEPGDRLYAIARLAAVKVWWVSDQVAPDLGGSWRALIQASAKPGQEITVSAVRIPAQVYFAPTDTPGATPGPPPTPAQIRTDLRANGSGSRWVDGESPPVAVRGPAG